MDSAPGPSLSTPGVAGTGAAEVPAPPPGHPRFRWGRSLALLLILGAAVHLLLPKLATVDDSLRLLRRLHWWLLALAVVAQAASYAGSGYMLSAIAGLTGESLPVRTGVGITVAASSVALVAGGQLGFAAASWRWTRGRGLSPQAAFLVGWLPSLFNNAILAALAVMGLAELLVLGRLSRGLAVAFGVVLTFIGLVALALLAALHFRSAWTRLIVRAEVVRARLRRRMADPARAHAGAQRLFVAWDVLRSGGWEHAALGAALNSSFDMLTLLLLFAAAGHAVGPALLLAGYGLPLLLGKFSFLPGGVGAVEASMAAIYGALGVPATTTVLVVLAYRVLSFWLPSLAGFTLLLHFRRPERRGTSASPPPRVPGAHTS